MVQIVNGHFSRTRAGAFIDDSWYDSIMKPTKLNRITLTQLRELNRAAYTRLRARMPERCTYAVLSDGTNLVAHVNDVRFFWAGTSWKVAPQSWLTLRTYALREGISEAEAHNRWRHNRIPGAYSVRGLVVVPVQDRIEE